MGRAIILFATVAMLAQAVAAQRPRSQDVALQAAVRTETVEGDLRKAIAQYDVVAKGADRAAAANALVRMAGCYEKLGEIESRRIYEDVLQRFADQTEPAATARHRLAALRSPAGGAIARRVLAGPDVPTGAISPDGRYLSFQIGNTGDLAVRDLTTGTTRNLTNTGGWVASGDYVEQSVFSPDGRQLAYLWSIEKDNRYELRVVPLVAGSSASARTVLGFQAGSEYALPVGWTPDGKRLIVERLLNRASQLGTVSIEDGSFRSLKSLEWRSPERISLSPDGRFLAYDVPEGANGSARDIKLLATDGSRETTVVQHPANDTSPVWSSDGSHVLFLSTRTGAVSLWAQPIAEGAPEGSPILIRSDLKGVTLIGTSRSGALYYHLRGGARENVYVADLDGMRVNRAPMPATASGTNPNRRPAWSHDGQYLASYASLSPIGLPNPRTNPTALVIRTVTTGVERVVPLQLGVVNTPLSPGPKWFPDNRSVLVLARDTQGAGLGFYRLDLDTAKTDLLWSFTHDGSFSFDLSPDGKSIFCTCPHSGQPGSVQQPSGRIVRFDIDGRRETVLRKDEWFITIAVSPDGAELAYVKTVRKNTSEYASVIEVVPTSGGTSRQVYRHPFWYDGSRYNTLAWTPDQRFLLFVRGENEADGSRQNLWRVAAAGGGQPEPVGVTSTGRIKTPAVRPDGKQLAFGLTEYDDSEVWTLENFLPARKSATK